MSGVTLPAATATTILTARTVKHEDRPPFPSELTSIFIVFGAGALLGSWNQRVGSLFSWGIVLAMLITDSSFLTPSDATSRSGASSGGFSLPNTRPSGKGQPAPPHIANDPNRPGRPAPPHIAN